jgi:hypothetical protein
MKVGFFISTKAMIMLYNVNGLCVWIRWFLDITSPSSLVKFLPDRGFAVKLASCHCCDAVCCLQQSLLHSKSWLKQCMFCLLRILDLIFCWELIQDIICWYKLLIRKCNRKTACRVLCFTFSQCSSLHCNISAHASHHSCHICILLLVMKIWSMCRS